MIPQLYSHIIEGQGPDLLILHGFLGMSDNWKTLGKRWADAGYRVHLIDQRNHGKSFKIISKRINSKTSESSGILWVEKHSCIGWGNMLLSPPMQ